MFKPPFILHLTWLEVPSLYPVASPCALLGLSPCLLQNPEFSGAELLPGLSTLAQLSPVAWSLLHGAALLLCRAASASLTLGGESLLDSLLLETASLLLCAHVPSGS